MPLGQILLDRNVIDTEQLEAARNRQKLSGGSLAESLVVLGAISREELDAILAEVPPQPVTPAETGLDAHFLLYFILRPLSVFGQERRPHLAVTPNPTKNAIESIFQV